jgi:hypothetical protein
MGRFDGVEVLSTGFEGRNSRKATAEVKELGEYVVSQWGAGLLTLRG